MSAAVRLAEMAVTTGEDAGLDELIEVMPGVFKRIGECTSSEIAERYRPRVAEVLRNRRGGQWDW